MHIWIVQHQLLRDKGVSPPVVVALFVQSPSPNSNYVALPSCVVVAVLLFCFKAAAAATTLPSHCCSNYVECSRATLYSVTSSGVSLHMLIITTGEIFMQLQSRLDLVIHYNPRGTMKWPRTYVFYNTEQMVFSNFLKILGNSNRISNLTVCCQKKAWQCLWQLLKTRTGERV